MLIYIHRPRGKILYREKQKDADIASDKMQQNFTALAVLFVFVLFPIFSSNP